MRNRFRVEIYDADKNNDLTILSDQGMDKETLSEIVFFHINRFNGKIRAYVFDTLKNKKTTALVLDEVVVEKYKLAIN